jgi:adenylate cyclase
LITPPTATDRLPLTLRTVPLIRAKEGQLHDRMNVLQHPDGKEMRLGFRKNFAVSGSEAPRIRHQLNRPRETLYEGTKAKSGANGARIVHSGLMGGTGDGPVAPKRTFYQRMVLRDILRRARKHQGEPLSPEDWAAVWELNDTPTARVVKRVWQALPSSPRCGMCGAPFAGPGRFVVRPFGYRPSRKNPTLCVTCVESSPPGGMKMYTGVLFADLRDFTARSEVTDSQTVAALLRRFYGCAEQVLFPEAIIDKVVGDEVMALYLPDVQRRITREQVPRLMVEHAMELLRAVGYDSPSGPFVEMGVGLDVGEAFVGNIGERAVYDFTAIGDVVNTASRLQGKAGGGEIVLSERVASGLPAAIGTPVELELKGKKNIEHAYCVSLRARS